MSCGHLNVQLQGFLPESWDQFAQNVVYKTFSPTVGFFLACSAAYGVWKVRHAISLNVDFSSGNVYCPDVCCALVVVKHSHVDIVVHATVEAGRWQEVRYDGVMAACDAFDG